MRGVLRKIGGLAVTMLLVSLLTFLAFSLISGDPASAMLGTEATPERIAALREELGLTRPLPVRYGEWLLGVLRGDFGLSYSYRTGVTALLIPKVKATLLLAAESFLLILAVSFPLGLLMASTKHPLLRGAEAAVSRLIMAVPPFFTGILLTWVFGIGLRWFTHGAYPSSLPGQAGYSLYAAICIALPRIAMTVTMLSGTLARETEREYVRTTLARGGSRGYALRRHILPNALPPIVSFLAQTLAEILTACVIVEQVFAIPGLGRFLVASISNRDYPVVEAIVVILALWVTLAGLAADLINAAIDPRLREEEEA
ncbi:MAG: ABC transporter permease [bacterium]